MSWSRGSLLAALLALPASIALADTVVVNTTADDVAANDLCSLREAVAFINEVSLLELDERPESRSSGCSRQGDASDVNIIKVPYSASAYVIDAAKGSIQIDASVTVQGEEQDSDAPKNPFIWSKASRVFTIDGPAVPVEVSGQPASMVKLLRSSTASDVDEENQTSNSYPYFSGPAEGNSLVCLYRQREGEEAVFLRSVTPVADAWQDRSPLPFPYGVNELLVVGTSAAECPAPPLASVTTIGSLKVNIYPASIVRFSLLDVVACGAPVSTLPLHMRSAGVIPPSCSTIVGKVAKGGVFYSTEALRLEGMAIRGGTADQGGIAYIERDGNLEVGGSALLYGDAGQGAALFLERSSLSLTNSLVAESRSGSEAVGFLSGVLPTGGSGSLIQNSTFHHNNGLALSVFENVRVNSVTILDNSAGSIRFSGADLSLAASKVFIFNSIISGDCSGAPADWPDANEPKFNLAPASCAFTDPTNVAMPSQLLAVADAEGKCDGDAVGVLCPRDPDDDGVVDFYVPRYLPSYTAFSDSPIINRASNEGASSCASQDQRNVDRAKSGRCDIGATEFRFNNAGAILSGGTIVNGSYTQPFAKDLGDEELFLGGAPLDCPLSLPSAPLTGGLSACPWLSDAPDKGTVRLTADRRGYVYSATRDYHGFDRFRIEVTTTASRLNEYTDPTSQTRSVQVTVSREPSSGATSDSLLGGGAIDILGLMGLFGLYGVVRRCQVRNGGRFV